MSNSSDWIAALSAHSPEPPDWLAGTSVQEGFVEGGVFGIAGAQAAQQPEMSPARAAIEAMRESAFAEGEAAARAEAGSERALRLSFRALDQAALDALAGELAETVIALCAQVIDEAAIDPVRLAERAAEAARRLGSAAAQCRLRLHPEDIAVLDEDAAQGWAIEPDPSLERGALRLEAPEGEAHDGPDEWRRAIAGALRE